MNVKDTNDNEPAFDPQSYSVEIKEDVAIGTSVAMVSATDTDSGKFSSYCIKKSNKHSNLTSNQLTMIKPKFMNK